MAKIVVCDDEPPIVYGLKFLLESEGHDVRTAGNGIEALALLTRQMPDLLITDIMMPKMSGFQLIEAVRNDAATNTLPIVVLTAKGQRSDAEYARQLGATDFVTKPFSPIKLRKQVQSLLGSRIEGSRHAV